MDLTHQIKENGKMGKKKKDAMTETHFRPKDTSTMKVQKMRPHKY